MIEKQSINGKDVWIEIEPHHVQRDNPRVIPTEYFTAKYYLQEPASTASASGELILDHHGQPKLFESPVAALEFANEKMTEFIHRI
jgi:hypothetical protein